MPIGGASVELSLLKGSASLDAVALFLLTRFFHVVAGILVSSVKSISVTSGLVTQMICLIMLGRTLVGIVPA